MTNQAPPAQTPPSPGGAPPSRPPRARTPGPPPGAPATQQALALNFAKPIRGTAGHRIVLYGPGGIGKTTLSSWAPGPAAFFDLDKSLGILKVEADIDIVSGVETWQHLRDTINAPGWDNHKTIIIDSGTKAEELAVDWVIQNVRHEKGSKITSIEDYGFGKGYAHVFDAFLTVLADLDKHVAAGRNVIIICHDCTNAVPNPAGEDWIRYEPRLQAPKSGKNSVRLRVREWADHVLFYGYDVDVRDGKGKGSGSRTLYPIELPICMAKSRTSREPLIVEDVAEAQRGLWSHIINGGE